MSCRYRDRSFLIPSVRRVLAVLQFRHSSADSIFVPQVTHSFVEELRRLSDDQSTCSTLCSDPIYSSVDVINSSSESVSSANGIPRAVVVARHFDVSWPARWQRWQLCSGVCGRINDG